MRLSIVALLGSAAALASWSALAADSWTDPQPGVRLLTRTETGSRPQQIHAAYVSLCEPGMHARATKTDERQQRTSTWAQSVDALVAVNGAFFDFTEYNAIGWSIGDGETWPSSWDEPHYSAVAFGSYARAKIFDTEDTFPPAESYWREMVPGDPLLIDDGVIVQEACYSHFCERHPRTAVGLTQDQKTVILTVVDGRSAAASGMTRLELAGLMAELGAYRALNFDGGGSTTMFIKGQGVVNHPTDSGGERVVSSHLGFVYVPNDKGCCQHETVPGATGLFKDIEDSSWVRPYAEALYNAQVTAGCQSSPLLFCPNCVADRASLAAFIARGLGLSPIAASTFEDVPPDAWYAGYVEALAQAGITTGCGGGRFCPDDIATRWQAAAFIYRGMGIAPATPTGRFTDADDTQAPILEALANACVVAGCDTNAFCPDREVTRAEIAKMLAVGFSIGPFAPCTEADAGVDSGSESPDSSLTDASQQDQAAPPSDGSTSTDAATGKDAAGQEAGPEPSDASPSEQEPSASSDSDSGCAMSPKRSFFGLGALGLAFAAVLMRRRTH